MEKRKESRELALQLFPHECAVCSLDEKNVLECHHIDSNPSNSDTQNLILLCPTCHEKITKNIWSLDPVDRSVSLTNPIVGLVEPAPGADLPPAPIMEAIEDFHRQLDTLEKPKHWPYVLFKDEKAGCYFIECHIRSGAISEFIDFDASTDFEEQEDYRINREMVVNHPAFIQMQEDARGGRQFADIVVEWNADYRPDQPLKLLGGQHRCESIKLAQDIQPNRYHHFRVYFGLSKDQRVEVARITNTSIAISNDLLDRMQENLLGPELREWCQEVGLLHAGQDFADRRTRVGVINVRLARTIIVNYLQGKEFNGDMAEVHEPYYCKAGPEVDKVYLHKRSQYPNLWNDTAFRKMGRKLARLHEKQNEASKDDDELRTKSEFRNKVITPAVLSAWTYVSGLLQKDAESLDAHYELPDDKLPSSDPLNALAMSRAKSKTDQANYRGLGARTDQRERGRLVEVFLIHSEPMYRKSGLPVKLLSAAIARYEVKVAEKDRRVAEKQAEEAAKRGFGKRS